MSQLGEKIWGVEYQVSSREVLHMQMNQSIERRQRGMQMNHCVAGHARISGTAKIWGSQSFTMIYLLQRERELFYGNVTKNGKKQTEFGQLVSQQKHGRMNWN